jgi:hypothetical protein
MWKIFQLPKTPMPAWAQRMERRIMSKIDDQAAALEASQASMDAKIDDAMKEITKISGESSEVLAALKDLQASGGVSPEASQKIDAAVAKSQSMDSKLANLAAALQSVDDIVEDKPVSTDPPADPNVPADPNAPPVAGSESTG